MRIIAMTNEGQLPMMKNMLNSAMKCGVDMSLFHCYILNDQKNAATYGTSQFKSITIRKLEVILESMKQDREILWVDNDIVFFENCVDNVRSYPGHFVMQDDLWSPCTGFFLVRQSPLSLSKIEASIRWLRMRTHVNVNDQHAFQSSIRTIPFVTPTLLDRDEYPNGEIYFNQKRQSRAKIVHCNYITTTAEKVERFKAHNLWDESDAAFDLVQKHFI